MLVHEPLALEVHPLHAVMSALSGRAAEVKSLRTGVYLTSCFGSSSFLNGTFEHYPDFDDLPDGTYRSPYGVCDDLDQVLAHYPELEAPGREFIVTLTEIRQDGQPETGGWRWHKWGPYIGAFEPQCEYLYDEDGIERVFCFHIYERKQEN